MMDVQQCTLTVESLSQVVIKMAIESWRFIKVSERMMLKMDAGNQSRFLSQQRWFLKQVEESLDEAGLHFVNIEGSHYDTGVAAIPLNMDEFNSIDSLVVKQMIEPIIMGKEGLVRMGTVMLKRVEK